MCRNCYTRGEPIVFLPQKLGTYSPTILEKKSLSFPPMICKFESNTTSDWPNRKV